MGADRDARSGARNPPPGPRGQRGDCRVCHGNGSTEPVLGFSRLQLSDRSRSERGSSRAAAALGAIDLGHTRRERPPARLGPGIDGNTTDRPRGHDDRARCARLPPRELRDLSSRRRRAPASLGMILADRLRPERRSRPDRDDGGSTEPSAAPGHLRIARRDGGRDRRPAARTHALAQPVSREMPPLGTRGARRRRRRSRSSSGGSTSCPTDRDEQRKKGQRPQ